MVFEALVVDVLNRFIGDYVENLDSSQLKIGIWGGDVVLQNLELKHSALNDLHLPIKTAAGRLGKLVLKIPWKSLYTSPVIATIEGLELLAVPNTGIQYDSDKEEAAKKEAKKKELQRIEEVKQKELNKNKTDPAQDTFTEKLVAQIIRNLQVTIKDIHLRYEDGFTNPLKPFAFGVTLHSLSFESTDDGWKIGGMNESQFVYKLVELDSLSFYWNSNEKLYSELPTNELKSVSFRGYIASSNFSPQNVRHVIGPINSIAKLKLNPKPENDGSNFTIPKVALAIDMEEIIVSLSKFQYQDIMELLQALERISVAAHYQRYRPVVPLKGNAKVWWHFAYESIVEEGVRRRKRNWSWIEMFKHRSCFKKYKEVYRQTLSTKKPSNDLKKQIESLEDLLDVFNICLARKQAEVEYARISSQTKSNESYSGWISSWLPWKKEKKNEEIGLVKKFEEAMNSQEKAKLYEAIGYQENDIPTDYPTTYVQNVLSFELHRLIFLVKDESLPNPDVLKFCLETVTTFFDMRPTASAFRVETVISKMTVYGLGSISDPPIIASSTSNGNESRLLDVCFEINPLDAPYDQQLRVYAEPLEIVYHAETVNKLAEVFRPPKSVALTGLQEAAKSTLKDFNELSATGLQHLISQQKILDIDINIKPSNIILPENGLKTVETSFLLAHLGSFKMHSIPRDRQAVDIRRLSREGSTESEKFQEMMAQSYDTFIIELTGVRIILCNDGSSCTADAITNEALQLLKPVDLRFEFQKCIITDDPRFPRMKMKGNLASFHVALSDSKLLQIASIVFSVPTPKVAPEDDADEALLDIKSSLIAAEASSATARHIATSHLDSSVIETPPSSQVTNLLLSFEIEKVSLSLYQEENNQITPLFSFAILGFGVLMSQKLHELSVKINVGGLSLLSHKFKSSTDAALYIVHTPMIDSSTPNLFTVSYLNVNKLCSEFKSVYKCIEQLLNIKFSTLNIVLHQEAILDAVELANQFYTKLEDVKKRLPTQDENLGQLARRRHSSAVSSVYELAKDVTVTRSRQNRRNVDEETVTIQVEAMMDSFSVEVCSLNQSIAAISIEGLQANIADKKFSTLVSVKLTNIFIRDQSQEAVYKEILEFTECGGFSAFNVKLINYKSTTIVPPNKIGLDAEIAVAIGCVKVICLNKFVCDVLNFVNHFQLAKQKIMEASAAAAAAAKENIQIVYQTASHVKLDFNIKAPIIIIPQNSKSNNVLVVDLGLLLITNILRSYESLHSTGMVPVLDDIKVGLENLKIIRGEIDPSTYILKAECNILEPLSCDIILERNLSISWYKDKPELSVRGKLNFVKVIMSQGDYATIMCVLNENLTEGQPIAYQAREDEVITTEIVGGPLQAIIELDESDENAVDRIFKRVLFEFHLESFAIDLYSGSVKDILIADRLRSPLAAFVLKTLVINGVMDSTGLFNVSVKLVNCLLDDVRTTRSSGITRLMEMMPGEDRCMFHIAYEQQPSGDKLLEVEIFSFTLIIYIEYLMLLANFFTKGMESTSKNEVNDTKSQTKIMKNKNKPEKAIPPPSNTTIRLKLKKPDIIVVEDINDFDTPGIIFNNELGINLKITAERQTLSINVANLQLITCCFNPNKRKSTMAEILSPCDISVTSSTPFGEGMHMDVNVTDINVHVTPSTIQLLSSISKSFAVNPQDAVEECKKETCELKDLSDLWDIKQLNLNEFWFIKTEEAQEAIDMNDDESLSNAPGEETRDEQIIFEMKSIIVTIESGIGSRAIPMLMLECSFTGEIGNWSNQLYVSSGFSMEMSYYNEKLAVYEPLIEPVEVAKGIRPWELVIDVKKDVDVPPLPPDDDIETCNVVPTTFSINIISQDCLELILTRTSLEVIISLQTAFLEAISSNIQGKKILLTSPYTVRNDSGLPISLILKEHDFDLYKKQAAEIEEVVLEVGTSVPLTLRDNVRGQQRRKSVIKDQDLKDDHNLMVKINEMNVVRPILVTKTCKRYFPLPHRPYPGDQWGMVAEIVSEQGFKVVTLRSNVQIFNHLSVPVETYFMTKGGNEVEFCGQVDSNSTLNLPLHAVYSVTSEIFFRPKYNGYSISSVPFVWKELQKNPNLSKVLQCNSKENGGQQFCMNVLGEIEQIYYENTNKKTIISTCYNLHLYATVTLCNHLPYAIRYSLKGVGEEVSLDKGDLKELLTAELNLTTITIKVPDYMDEDWICSKVLASQMEEVWTFISSKTKQILDLGMHVRHEGGSLNMKLYCPFWMVNKTGLALYYKRSKKTEKNASHGSPVKNEDLNNAINHPANFESPVLFSFRPKVFFSKKKAMIKIEDSEWSDKFTLDTVGSSGSVQCPVKGSGIYDVGVQIRLTNVGISKIVMFKPLYIVVNDATYDMEFREEHSTEFLTISAGQCLPFWPKFQMKKKSLIFRVSGTTEETKPFSYGEVNSILLRLNNRKGGINAECHITEDSVVIVMNEYKNGMATVRLVNHCKYTTINYHQTDLTKDVRSLPPEHFVLYTWDDPNIERQLTWFPDNKKDKMKTSLVKDDFGGYPDGTIFWVSLLDDTQRVLMITDDLALATQAQCAVDFEVIDQKILISLQGVGLSLVDDSLKRDVMYLALVSSGVIWESSKGNSRFRPFNVKECQSLEQAYQKYLNESKVNKKTKSRLIVDGKLEVDFQLEMLYRPHEGKLRRIFLPGFWTQCKTSSHQVQLHSKIYRLQIDSQLDDCVFPTVLAPIPMPKSVAADTAPKPFAEASLIWRKNEHSSVSQFKYFKVLVQEFHVKLDKIIINALISLFSPSNALKDSVKTLIAKDQKIVLLQLKDFAAIASTQEQKNFYDILHFSPLKVHVSFSMQGSSSPEDSKNPTPIHSDFLNLLLQSVGVTVTEIQDVVFRLAFFEKQHVFMSHKQLTNEAVSHYAAQGIKQLYVLVLGLDVIGNPFGLVMGLGKGIEDFFYEPFQGAVQGPEEFAEGLALGLKSLFGHAVGGAAGAVSRITGTLGKGIASLTLDSEYQRKRREALSRRPANLQEGLARSGKGLVMGVFDGVTGVFVKPIEGAKQEGVEGFFKGMGKGVVGLVTRPTSGVIDFASGSLDAVKRATDLSEEIHRLRTPRYFQPDGIVRPYNKYEADGNKLLKELEKGKFALTDYYIAHVVVTDDGKSVFLVTDQRMIMLTKGDIFGQWNCEWNYTWDKIRDKPRLNVKPNGILISLKEVKKKKIFGFLSGNQSGIIVEIKYPEVCEWILGKIHFAMERS